MVVVERDTAYFYFDSDVTIAVFAVCFTQVIRYIVSISSLF